ncbi:hypothetical protein ACQRBN_03590 [Bariatricus sp. SGI.154]|uniref:hypothetical protein n=1 Tax=Bariatricus sp. SGI.154 TaxID=3420549 RepID=UPI003CFD10D5
MNEVMNMGTYLQGLLEGTSEGDVSYFLAWATQMLMIMLAVTAVVGLIICFFGLKLSRILAAITGLVIGAVIGVGIAVGFGLKDMTILIAIAACAVICAVLFGLLRRLGIFFLVFVEVAGIFVSLAVPNALILGIVGVVVAIVMAILSVIFTEPIVILVTGISGGLAVGNAAVALLGMSDPAWIGYVIGAVVALIGIWIQFMMHSRKIGKKEKVYSEQVKEKVSVESEVEKARRILEDDDDEHEDSKKENAADDSNEKNDEEDDDDIKIIEEEI